MEASSPLMELPPELRNRIYRYTIVTDEPIDVTETTKKKEPALLGTCKRIRDEALQMFYHENTFHCDIHSNYDNGEEDVREELAGFISTSLSWLTILGVATTSFITDFRIRFTSDMADATIAATGWDPKAACDNYREEVNSSGGEYAFAFHLMDFLRFLGMKSHAVKFRLPTPLETFDDVINQVLQDEWEQILEDEDLKAKLKRTMKSPRLDGRAGIEAMERFGETGT